VAPLQPANCGFDVGWSEHLASHHAGAPLKNVVLRCTGPAGQAFERKGECVITATGLEGNLVYAASALLRDQILRQGRAELTLDLRPDRSLDELRQALARGGAPARWPTTCASRRASRGGRGPAARGVSAEDWARLSKDAAWLAGRIKALPVTLSAPVRWTRPSARPAGCGWRRWTGSCVCARRRASRWPARCSTGRPHRRLPAHRLPGQRGGGRAGPARGPGRGSRPVNPP
jgi:predicted flavoprotein YhiN